MKKLTILTAAIALLALTGCSKSKVVINGKADLEGKKIGVQAGTTGEWFVEENIPGAQIASFKS